MNGPSHLIEVHEKIVDQAVKDIPFSLICAYIQKRIPEDLNEVLLKMHPYILEDGQTIVSKEYASQI